MCVSQFTQTPLYGWNTVNTSAACVELEINKLGLNTITVHCRNKDFDSLWQCLICFPVISPADGLPALSFSISTLTLIGMLAVITYTVSRDPMSYRAFSGAVSANHAARWCAKRRPTLWSSFGVERKRLNSIIACLLFCLIYPGFFFFSSLNMSCNTLSEPQCTLGKISFVQKAEMYLATKKLFSTRNALWF